MTDFSDYKGIWVFCEQRSGELMPTDFELISEAKRLAAEMDCKVTGLLLGCAPDRLAGRGAGLSDCGFARKKEVLLRSIAVNSPDPGNPIDLLQKVGGLDLAALCGACLGAAASRIPVLLDGMITDAAALCAVRLCPGVSDALIASHESKEPAARPLLEELGLCPMISAGLRLGEGSGAVLALGLLDQALEVYHSRHTFDALGIEAYTPQ